VTRRVTVAEMLPDGGAVVRRGGYQLVVDREATFAWFGPDAPGRCRVGKQDAWLRLCLLSSLDTLSARDETLGVPELELLEGDVPAVVLSRRSSCWESAWLRIDCHARRLELTSSVTGAGRLGEVRLLGGRATMPGRCGELFSGCPQLATLFSPNPEDPTRLLRSTREPAVIGVSGDALPGRGHWFFTPAPLLFALARDAPRLGPSAGERGASFATAAAGGGESGEAPAPWWLGVGLCAPVEALRFGELAWQPSDGGFGLRMDYEGQTEVDGAFDAPTVVLEPGLPDPYAALASQRELLVERRLAQAAPRHDRQRWWSSPMFCGWGAQCHLAAGGGSPQDACTQANYDRFLAELAGHDLVPPTVVIDDGWQASYGLATPDERRWPDLSGWIRRRHEAGQRVLLWWKAWDTTGVPDELCLRNSAGAPLAIDPRPPASRALIAEVVTAMLAADGLDADGLKIDFTARTPSGSALWQPAGGGQGPPGRHVPAVTTEGGPPRAAGGWGIALLHELLAAMYDAAKSAKHDALVITQAPHPSFADVADMIRLNDMLRLDDPVPASPLVEQMRYRAAVAHAACPQLLVDTDDWCVPDLAQWRDYLAVKGEIGVPALYYTTHLDRTGEALEETDYAALRELWS
jgi:hypothetical protein